MSNDTHGIAGLLPLPWRYYFHACLSIFLDCAHTEMVGSS